MDVAAAMLLSLLALLAGTGHARSAGAGEAIVEIERLTWMEIRDRIAAGHRTVIVPTGGTEQNGPHMVTGKHNIIVAETARRIARALGDALVAPVLAYVPEGDPAVRAGHMAYPGTISLPEPAFAQVLQAAALSHSHRRPSAPAASPPAKKARAQPIRVIRCRPSRLARARGSTASSGPFAST